MTNLYGNNPDMAQTKFMWRKSWTAYIKSIAILSVSILVLIGVAMSVYWEAVFLVLPLVLVVAYNILLLRSYKFFYDDNGVWVFSGILPWNKGIRGVKWRDVDEAVFKQTFLSWLLKSYTIRISQRFTESSEIMLTQIHRGHEAVMEINLQLQRRVTSNNLVS